MSLTPLETNICFKDVGFAPLRFKGARLMPEVDGHVYPLVVDQYCPPGKIFFLNPKGLYWENGIVQWGGMARISQQSSVPVQSSGGHAVSTCSGSGQGSYTPPGYPKTVPVTSVAGTTFTVSRDAVLAAAALANTPIPQTLPNLTRLRYKGASKTLGVLITGDVQRSYAEHRLFGPRGIWTVVLADGRGDTYDTIPDLLRFWEVIQ